MVKSWQQVGSLFKSVGILIKDNIGKVWEWIKWPFEKAWAWIIGEDGPKSWPGKIWSFLEGIGSKIAEGGQWLWDQITWPFTKAWEWLTSEDGPKSWPGKVWSWMQEMGQKILDGAAWIGEAIASPFVKAWEWIIGDDGPKSWPGKIWEFLSGIGSFITEHIADAVEWFAQIFRKVWDWIANPEGEGPASWPGKIWGFIKGIGDKLADGANWLQEQGAKIATAVALFMLRLIKKVFPDKLLDLIIPGGGIDDLIARLESASNIKTAATPEQIANAQAATAAHTGAVEYQQGGVTNWARSLGKLATVHGQEAIIPLVSGSVPVTLMGAANGETTVNNNFGDMTFVVRDDNDIEEIKKAILELRSGQTTYFDNPSMYSERF
jgi:hypothetical protein